MDYNDALYDIKKEIFYIHILTAKIQLAFLPFLMMVTAVNYKNRNDDNGNIN
jgi:hypothetical protein